MAHGKNAGDVNLSNITSMFRKVTGDTSVTLVNNKIQPAPERYLLKMFGGPLTIEEFRASFALNVRTSESRAPLIPWEIYCEFLGGKPNQRQYLGSKGLSIRKSAPPPSKGSGSWNSGGNGNIGTSGPVGGSGAVNVGAPAPPKRTTVGSLISFG